MIKQNVRFILALACIFLGPSVALADRSPTNEERTKIDNVLRAEGFTSWQKIALEDNGKWEVDDAIGADGRQYDIKLDQQFRIIERKLD
jgi:hypothetical protein